MDGHVRTQYSSNGRARRGLIFGPDSGPDQLDRPRIVIDNFPQGCSTITRQQGQDAARLAFVNPTIHRFRLLAQVGKRCAGSIALKVSL